GIQLVVATVPSLQDTDIESFANGLFRFWKLGETKKNNGVLFLIAPTERKMRIEVGYGLEGTLTDALSKVIIATAVTPKFKTGDYGAGVERGVDAIIEVLSGDAAEWQKRVKVRAEGQDAFDDIVPLIMIALFLFVFLSMLSNARGGRRAYRGGRGPIVYLPPSNDTWSGGSSWGSGSGSSWGGGDGGGFSGGGGSSGGGGASGDW
ncbi:MAG TPA: TPM domain-containing protein, partial [Methylocystis sp.]